MNSYKYIVLKYENEVLNYWSAEMMKQSCSNNRVPIRTHNQALVKSSRKVTSDYSIIS